MTRAQAVRAAASYYFRKRLAADLPDLADRLEQFIRDRNVQTVGRFRVHLNDDPADPFVLVPLPPTYEHQLVLWDDLPE